MKTLVLVLTLFVSMTAFAGMPDIEIVCEPQSPDIQVKYLLAPLVAECPNFNRVIYGQKPGSDPVKISTMGVKLWSPSMLFTGSLKVNGNVVLYYNGREFSEGEEKSAFLDVHFSGRGPNPEEVRKMFSDYLTDGPIAVICKPY